MSICGLASFKDNVATDFFAPPAVLADPAKKLEGGGKGYRMLPGAHRGRHRAGIQRWLKDAVEANR
jgi:hypothetical protein